MITIKEVSNNKEKVLLSHFLQHHHNMDINQSIDHCRYMIVMDSEHILGYAAFEIQSTILHINELFIMPIERGHGLGDGLLRSTLNLANQQGVEWALINHHQVYHAFYKHVGLQMLEAIEHIPEFVKSYHHTNDYHRDLLICIPKFFQKKCKSHGSNI
ncbi:GCN5-related N-acetyltransferase [Alkaliphilus metalliredigens QYMF]|uniref:GCN5-related N-acetyltransferase n=1 Tax=Alkaliphilus metalliredigens (strain QYMF) TaxID=293826 RepID=A6TRH3_ALKMQ|nr:GNAT family N-acetyltransferase [Alkaliphilus metalliredigens]ABR48791.1 GCN5-related N-acetyltransferase [Alkaliphilus metalliredigens QYMF]